MNLRNFVIWGVIIVVLIGLYSMMTGGGRSTGAKEISYTQLLQKVDAGEIKSAEVQGPTLRVTDQSNKPFVATTPNNQDDIMKRLEGQGANISVKAPGGFTLVSF